MGVPSKELPVSDKEAAAEKTIKKYMYWSVGAGLIPVPLVDLAAVTGIQLKMIADLAKQYNTKFSKQSTKAILSSLVGGGVTAEGGPIAASLVKGIPLIGQTAGALTMPAVAGASTYAIGKVFVAHFESGGTLLDFDPDKMRAYYADELHKSKKAATA
jgi:uncharacterized protein (DUF697 family)